MQQVTPEVRCETGKVGQVKRIDAVASSFLGAAQLQRIINNSATQTCLGSRLQRSKIVFFVKNDDFAMSYDRLFYIAVSFGGVNHRAKGKASEGGEGFRQPVRGDYTLVPTACYLDEDGDGSSVVHMMSYGQRYQYRSVEVQPHSNPATCCMRSSRSSRIALARSSSP